ncbi:MAG: envelope protein [Tadarida brasiliensis bat alphacoronavirus 2]|nr:MAG: envelope protein [Tadarida brasiliensis bat alphacoronavirus 2]UZK98255.1 MAG: envelope protein [Tadarida brasiliensis bat alphacoronavirus 2]
MLLRLVNDNGLVVNVILWLFVIFFLLIICVTAIQVIQLCFTCHQLCNRTVYAPVRSAYRVYQDFMRIEPLPVIDV